MVNEFDPAFAEVTENVAFPFWVFTVDGRLFPFICMELSPELSVIFNVSLATSFLLQSRISTEKLIAAPTTAVDEDT